MAKSSGSFPHPVLGHADDVASTFDIVNVYVTPAVEDIEVKFRYKTDDPDLTRLLNRGEAELIAWWTCPVTMTSRRLELSVQQIHADGQTYVGWIDQREVRDNVDVDVSVIATTRMPAFSWANQHVDYGFATFDIRKGDILAEGGSFRFSANKLYDPMQPPLGSCFRITPDSTVKKGMKLDFSDDEQVIVRMSEDMIAGLQSIGHRPDLQISLVVLPALMQTITFIQKNESDPADEDLSNTPWYLTVRDLMRVSNRDSEAALDIAQEILQHPTTKVLTDPLFTDEEE